MNRDALKTLRTAAHLTQAELANLAGIDASYIWKLESGRRDGSATVLWKLADALANTIKRDVRDVLIELAKPN